jgi:hypothetical protein
MAFGLAVYASPSSLPPPAQDSLPAAGQALPDGLSTRKVPMKGFKVVLYILFSLLKLTWHNRCNLSALGVMAICGDVYLQRTPLWSATISRAV